MKTFLSASLMCGNLLDIKEDLKILKNYVDYLHVDISDYSFVKNITFGFDFVDQLRTYSNLPLDIHLMTNKAEEIIKELRLKNADIVSYHLESKTSKEKLLKIAKNKQCKVGIFLNPETSINKAYKDLKYVDYVNIMCVPPGFSGQKFIPSSYEKVLEFSGYLISKSLQCNIGVDGAIGIKQIRIFSSMGVKLYVLGTKSIYNKNGLENNLLNIRTMLDRQNNTSAYGKLIQTTKI